MFFFVLSNAIVNWKKQYIEVWPNWRRTSVVILTLLQPTHHHHPSLALFFSPVSPIEPSPSQMIAGAERWGDRLGWEKRKLVKRIQSYFSRSINLMHSQLVVSTEALRPRDRDNGARHGMRVATENVVAPYILTVAFRLVARGWKRRKGWGGGCFSARDGSSPSSISQRCERFTSNDCRNEVNRRGTILKTLISWLRTSVASRTGILGVRLSLFVFFLNRSIPLEQRSACVITTSLRTRRSRLVLFF